MNKKSLLSLIILLLLQLTLQAASPLGTAFTYQGRLTDNGSLANGNYDLRFSLYDAVIAGGQIGPDLTNAPVAASNACSR